MPKTDSDTEYVRITALTQLRIAQHILAQVSMPKSPRWKNTNKLFKIKQEVYALIEELEKV